MRPAPGPFHADGMRLNRAPGLLSVNNFHYRRAGSDAAFLDHDRLFRARGWQTAVFSMKHEENLASPWQAHFVQEIELARTHSAANRLRLAAKAVYSLEARRRLSGLLTRFRPDVVHVHSVYHHLSPAVLPALKRQGVPIILTAHDYKLACPAYKMFDGKQICEACRPGSVAPLIRKRCIHGSLAMSSLVAFETILHRWLGSYLDTVSSIVCPSRFLMAKLIDWGWPPERLTCIVNFFDPDIWRPRFEPGKYFLYFGRLAPEKGLATLVRAAAISRQPVKIVGWGQMLQELRSLTTLLDAPVELIDRVDAGRLAELIQQARVVVLPSEWYENASLAVLESFACGKPVIASRIGGNPELVIAGTNGWLFQAGNHEELAALMTQAADESESDLQSRGRAAHDWVHRHRGPDRYFDSMTALYRSLGARVGTPADLAGAAP